MSLFLISYIIAAVLFIASLILERKIAVWELLIALLVLAIPYVNALAFIINLVMILDYRGIIYLRGIGHGIVNILNRRIK